MHPAALRSAYRMACIRAGLDPAVGPATSFEVARAIAEHRRAVHARSRWWIAVNWAPDGACRSVTEYLALIAVDAEARGRRAVLARIIFAEAWQPAGLD